MDILHKLGFFFIIMDNCIFHHSVLIVDAFSGRIQAFAHAITFPFLNPIKGRWVEIRTMKI